MAEVKIFYIQLWKAFCQFKMDVDFFHGNGRMRYQQIKNSLVQVACLLRDPEKSNRWKTVRKTKSIIAAVPIVSEDKFCCLVALKDGLFFEDDYQYEVVFPNKKTVPLRRQDIATVADGKLVLFAFHTTGDFVESVKFSTERVKMLDDILLAGFQKPRLVPCHVSSGKITFVGKKSFSHASPYFRHTARGDFLFNTKREVIGICYLYQGITRALNVASIRSELAKILNRQMANAPLSEIIKFIKDAAKVGKSDNDKRNATNLDVGNPSKRLNTGSSAGFSAHEESSN